MALTNESVDYAATQRFHRMTPGYILIFTQDEKPKKSVEISVHEAESLTDYDKAWLRNCVEVVLIETVTSEDSIEKTMTMLEQFEQALQEEQANQEKKSEE